MDLGQNGKKPLKYSSIAMSGRPGAGRSTLLKNLRPYLEPLHFEFFSGGDWSRQFSIQAGKQDPNDTKHHLATDYGDDVDLQIDVAMREKISDPVVHMAIESWIAGWNARGINHVLKVLLMCDDALRIDRIVNRDNITVEDAKAHIRMREEGNLAKWQRMYKTDDFWDPKHYDLIINTYSHGPLETLDLVLQALGYFSANGQQAAK
ncbi:cytidylate kinase family protein [Candidatus Gottesmanbacteria bacterium]|nr:cytidylate kinase family protein [Candidatus Gottesmanbacteria bacterium]